MRDKWIHVTDRLPENDRWVLALELYGTDPPFQEEYYIAWYSENRKRWVDDSTGVKIRYVCWWCELPKPPEDRE